MATFLQTLSAWWPALFVCGTLGATCLIDPIGCAFPPRIDLSGAQAKRFLLSPWAFGVLLPMVVGLISVRSFAKSNKLSVHETGNMVWWVVNMFWFHTGCDIFSGYWQVMPVLTDMYKEMTPAHLKPVWHEARAHLDSGYFLELFIEVPMCIWCLYLIVNRDPGRHIAEVFAVAIQFAGTVTYYAPAVMRGEERACWISYLDHTCGIFWIAFPIILMRRHLEAARSTYGKAKPTKAKRY